MAYLTVMSGVLRGQKYALADGINRIGRREENNWVLADGSVSGTHCEIEMNPAGFLLRDLGSTNGTKVNNVPVKEKFIYRDDVIYIGEVPVTITGDDVPLLSEQLDAQLAVPRTTIAVRPDDKSAAGDSPEGRNGNNVWIAVVVLLVLVIASLVAMLVFG